MQGLRTFYAGPCKSMGNHWEGACLNFTNLSQQVFTLEMLAQAVEMGEGKFFFEATTKNTNPFWAHAHFTRSHLTMFEIMLKLHGK